MEKTFKGQLTNEQLTIQFDHHLGEIQISTTSNLLKDDNKVFIYFSSNTILGVNLTKKPKEPITKTISILPGWEIDSQLLGKALIEKLTQLQLIYDSREDLAIPKNQKGPLNDYLDELMHIFDLLSVFTPTIHLVSAEKQKKKPAKVRHRWTKEISEIPFYIDTRQSKATVYWHKRNEMLIKAGATMMKEIPLNKDGSIGFAAKLGEKIREDHKQSIKNFKTTEDVILKSVNEVGIFLYFAGTNSWLELKDKEGKTLNEWTIVD